MNSTSARITRGAIALLSVFGLFFGATAIATATPAKPPKPPIEKVAICQYDVDTSAWELVLIKDSVAAKLVARGQAAYPLEPVPGTDGAYIFDAACVPQPVTPVETIFAVAYSDRDTTDGPYNAAVDVLIAKLIDGNGDGILNAGDKVITSQYPTWYVIADWAADFGAFTVTEHVISGSDGCDATVCNGLLAVPIPGGTSFWSFEFYQSASWGQRYMESIPFGAATIIQDDLGGAYQDKLEVNPESPSQPAGWIYGGRPGYTTDDAFVDVDIYVS